MGLGLSRDINNCENSDNTITKLSLDKQRDKLGNLIDKMLKLNSLDSDKFRNYINFELKQLEIKLNEIENEIDIINSKLDKFNNNLLEIPDIHDEKLDEDELDEKLHNKTIKDLLPYYMMYYMNLQNNQNIVKDNEEEHENNIINVDEID